MAIEFPDIFDQIWFDMELAATKDPEEPSKPSWKKPGESAAQARDRLRREREESKRRLGR